MTASSEESKSGKGRRSPLRVAGWIALSVIGVLVVVLVGAFVAAAVVPAPVPPSSPDPAADYDEARAKLEALLANDSEEVGHPTIFMDQGSITTTAVVLLHGYTNNPGQFEELGNAYFEAGYNVLIPRLPGHGMKDVMTRDLSDVDAAALVTATDEAIDIAAGLGENVEVVGLSGGGTLAAWAAYNRDEVVSSAPISPFFDPAPIPVVIVRPLTEIIHALPDIYVWWDPSAKEKHLPPTAYPRFSTRSLSAFIDIGESIAENESQRSTRMDRVIYISNAADDSVNEEYGDLVFEEHVAPLASQSSFYEFEESLGYAHDLIDPAGLNADHIEAIYTELYDWLGVPPPTR